jgi:hypothetical protein
MHQVTRWLRKYVVPFGLLTLLGAGCVETRDGGSGDVTPTASSDTTAWPAAFVAEARAMTFGSKDLTAASDGQLLRLGRVVCDGLGIEGLGFGGVLQRLVRSEARPTTIEARALVVSAVRNLCPEYAPAIRADGKYELTAAVVVGRSLIRMRG